MAEKDPATSGGNEAQQARAGLSKTGKEVAQKLQRAAQAGKTAAERAAQAGRSVADRANKAGKSAAARAAEAGKGAREIGAQVQQRVKKAQQELAPATAKAKKGIEQATQGIGKALQATARATRKSARILGLKTQIAAATRKRQKLFGEIGEKYFALQKRKGPAPAGDKALADLVKAAEAANREIRDLEAKEKLERQAP